MKILVISNLFPPYTVGGYEIRCSEFVKKLGENGYDVVVATSYYGLKAEKNEDKIYRVFDHGWSKFHSKKHWIRECCIKNRDVKHFERILDKEKPDRLLIFSMNGLSRQLFSAVLNCPLEKRFEICDEWILEYREEIVDILKNVNLPGKNSLEQIKKNVMAQMAQKRIGVNWQGFNSIGLSFISQDLLDRYKKRQFPVERGEVIHNYVDLKMFNFKNSRLQGDMVQILVLGQVMEHKGIHTVIESIKILKQKYDDKEFLLHVVGGSASDEYLERLNTQIKENNLQDNVKLHGQVKREVAAEFFRDCDIYVFPVIWEEPFAGTLLEAMASGIPVISTFTGGSKEILKDGINALVFEKDDAKDLSEKILKLVNNGELANVISQNARKEIEDTFSKSVLMDKSGKLLSVLIIMKIAVYHNLPTGGAKRALQQFVKELSKDHTLDEYTLSTSVDYLPLKDHVENSYVYALEHKALKRTRPYIVDSFCLYLDRVLTIQAIDRVAKRIADDINSRDYDVVHVDLDRVTHAPSILKYIKKPMVYFCHDPKRSILEPRNFESDDLRADNPVRDLYNKANAFFINRRNLVTNKADISYVKTAPFLVTNSYYTREYIHKVYGKMAHVNYLGVDTDIFKHLNLPRENYILSVGRIYRIKGHHHIVKAMGLLPEKDRPVLKLVGDCSSDEEKDFLVNLAKSNNVQLEICELIDDDKLVELYNKALMTIYVPEMEPFGFVPLEAMACGSPVIGVREGGIRESVKEGETGLLVDRDDEELSEAILKLKNNEELRTRISENSVEYVKVNWTWAAAAQRLVKNYEKCIRAYGQDTNAI